MNMAVKLLIKMPWNRNNMIYFLYIFIFQKECTIQTISIRFASDSIHKKFKYFVSARNTKFIRCKSIYRTFFIANPFARTVNNQKNIFSFFFFLKNKKLFLKLNVCSSQDRHNNNSLTIHTILLTMKCIRYHRIKIIITCQVWAVLDWHCNRCDRMLAMPWADIHR